MLGIANLGTAYTYASVISGSGVIVPLIAMLSSPDFLSQRYIMQQQLITLLSTNILSPNSLIIIITSHLRYAAMGVGNLATYPINQVNR